LALALAVIIAVSGAILLTRANAYRPLTYGLDGSGGLRYPGLPAGHGIRDVNNLGGFRQDHYIPPQRGTFYLFASVMNTGSRAVIIEKVSLPRFSHLVLVSPIRYGRPSGPNTSGIGPANRILHNVRLGANKQIFIAFPVHSWPCAKTRNSGWSAVPRFYVHYRSCSSIMSRRCPGDLTTTRSSCARHSASPVSQGSSAQSDLGP
jgi:hypothetical protein